MPAPVFFNDGIDRLYITTDCLCLIHANSSSGYGYTSCVFVIGALALGMRDLGDLPPAKIVRLWCRWFAPVPGGTKIVGTKMNLNVVERELQEGKRTIRCCGAEQPGCVIQQVEWQYHEG